MSNSSFPSPREQASTSGPCRGAQSLTDTGALWSPAGGIGAPKERTNALSVHSHHVEDDGSSDKSSHPRVASKLAGNNNNGNGVGAVKGNQTTATATTEATVTRTDDSKGGGDSTLAIAQLDPPPPIKRCGLDFHMPEGTPRHAPSNATFVAGSSLGAFNVGVAEGSANISDRGFMAVKPDANALEAASPASQSRSAVEDGGRDRKESDGENVGRGQNVKPETLKPAFNEDGAATNPGAGEGVVSTTATYDEVHVDQLDPGAVADLFHASSEKSGGGTRGGGRSNPGPGGNNKGSGSSSGGAASVGGGENLDAGGGSVGSGAGSGEGSGGDEDDKGKKKKMTQMSAFGFSGGDGDDSDAEGEGDDDADSSQGLASQLKPPAAEVRCVCNLWVQLRVLS